MARFYQPINVECFIALCQFSHLTVTMYVMPSVYSWELQPKSNDEMPDTFSEEYNKGISIIATEDFTPL